MDLMLHRVSSICCNFDWFRSKVLLKERIKKWQDTVDYSMIYN